jgi:hypothetical protein
MEKVRKPEITSLTSKERAACPRSDPRRADVRKVFKTQITVPAIRRNPVVQPIASYVTNGIIPFVVERKDDQHEHFAYYVVYRNKN